MNLLLIFMTVETPCEQFKSVEFHTLYFNRRQATGQTVKARLEDRFEVPTIRYDAKRVQGRANMGREIETEPGPPDRHWLSIERHTPDNPVVLEATDCVAVEAPLEIRLHGRPAAVLMRTPGNDRELVTGFLFCEGVISHPGQIISIDPVDDALAAMDGQVVDVRLDSPSRGRGIERFFYSTSSCGACGKRSIDSLEVRHQQQTTNLRVSMAVLQQALDISRSRQSLFVATGGSHASALFKPGGEPCFLREDVGRHNALDKAIGASLLAGLIPLDNHILAISGRVGYEIIQKASTAGIPVIVAVGAPTTLAVNLAVEHGITLAGFARQGAMNIYSHSERIEP